MRVDLFVDGAVSGNGNVSESIGGWAYIYVAELRAGSFKKATDHRNIEWKLKHGSVAIATNQTMELMSCIKGLEAIAKEYKDTETEFEIHVFSDSAYLVNCFLQDWIGMWKVNGWKNAKGEDVKNRELWEKLKVLEAKFKLVKFHHVKGHAGHLMNCMCDELATKAVLEAKIKRMKPKIEVEPSILDGMLEEHLQQVYTDKDFE